MCLYVYVCLCLCVSALHHLNLNLNLCPCWWWWCRGSLEYGTPVKGQVIGGRWKPLHHMMEQSAYTDVTAACGKAAVTVSASPS
jgi:hypothetical protein